MLRGTEFGLLLRERAPAGVHDERIVGEHVAPAGARRPQAEVVLLAVARAERRIEHADRRRAARAAGTCRSRRRSEGPDRSAPPPPRAPRRTGSGIAPRGPGIVLAEARERADLGVVRERRDRADARDRSPRNACSASSQPRVTIVSELSSTTSARDSCMPRLAVPVKPRLRSLRSSTTCGCARRSSSAKNAAMRRIGRSVVDQHQAHVGTQVREHARRHRRGRRPARCRPAPRCRRRRAACAGAHPPRTRCHHSRTRSHGSETTSARSVDTR